MLLGSVESFRLMVGAVASSSLHEDAVARSYMPLKHIWYVHATYNRETDRFKSFGRYHQTIHKGETTMIKDRNYYEIRLAKLIANGETMNARLINKIRRKLRGLPA